MSMQISIEEKRRKTAEYNAAYRARNREACLARSAKFRADNPNNRKEYYKRTRQAALAYAAKYRASHADEIKASRAEYYKNKGHIRTPKKAASQAEYRKRHAEKVKAYQAAYRAENKATTKAYNAEYRAKNKAELELNARAYREKNKDAIAAWHRAYQKENLEATRSRNQKRRALKRGAKVGNQKLIIAWEKEWRKKKTAVCYWCLRKSITENCHSDHIQALSIGGSHSIENLCIACSDCNHKKSKKPLSRWNSEISEPVLL